MRKSKMVTFDKETHTYHIDGKKVPSVTQIIKDVGLVDYSGVSEEYLKQKAEIGTNIHLYLQYIDTQVKCEIPDQVKPIIDAWFAFKEKYKVEILFAEQPVGAKILGFACTPDRYASVGGSPALIEIKTTAVIGKEVGYQMAGQMMCMEENKYSISDNRYVFRVGLDGKWEARKLDNYQKDRSVFLSALVIYKAKRGL